jgi:butyryl-CoA dehydrogenase
MPIDFTLNDNQQRLRREARQFAKDVLSGVAVATRDLPGPIERFVATRPFYECLVAEGFLRKCIPVSVGGDCAGLFDLAILAEEFYTVDPNVSLTMLSTVLGLTPLVVGGTPEQRQRRISIARRRRAHHRAASGRLVGHLRPEAMDIRGHRMER